MEEFRQKHFNKGLIDVIIYHHPCQDGQASSWVVKNYLDSINKKYELIGVQHYDYEKQSFVNMLYERVKDKYVVVVDFSFSYDITINIKKLAKGIVILDHHITNKEKLETLDYAYFDMNFAGVGLSWKYIHGEKEMPLFIQMIQDRDLWKWEIPLSKDFCEGVFNYLYITANNDEAYKIYDEIYADGKLDKYIEYGKIVRIKKEKTINKIVRNSKKVYRYTYKGKTYRVKLANCEKDIASDLGNALCENDGCDFSVCWRYDHGLEEYWMNLRSRNDTDVAEISKRFNGGGHKKAAACAMKQHPSIVFGK